MSRLAILIGAGNIAAAIMLSAYGAHALRGNWLQDRYSIFQIAVDYHLYHSLGLVVVGLLLAQHTNRRLLNIAAVVLLTGIVLFSGGLYTLSLSGLDWAGKMTPFGGIALIGAWGLVMLSYIKK